jgi:hypothetical protein
MLQNEIQTILRKEIEVLKNSLAYGSCSDYAMYMNTVGRISGLEWAAVEIKRIVNTIIYEEDDD